MKDFVFQEILFKHNQIDSTNEEAKRMIMNNDGTNCFIIISEIQTLGKGRMQRSWQSSIKGNIYMTIVIHNNLLPNDAKDILPLYTAFAIMNAIGKQAEYKWVNDIIIKNKKVAGILIEKLNDFFIIGIGVNNLNHPANTLFPAGNLKEFNLFLTPIDIFSSFKNSLEKRKDFIINYLEKKFFTTNIISINQNEFIGTFKKIKPNGNLIIRDLNGTLTEISFGDVSAF